MGWALALSGGGHPPLQRSSGRGGCSSPASSFAEAGICQRFPNEEEATKRHVSLSVGVECLRRSLQLPFVRPQRYKLIRLVHAEVIDFLMVLSRMGERTSRVSKIQEWSRKDDRVLVEVLDEASTACRHP